MREIKFRAWDTETKEMSYDFLSKNWLRVCIESPYVELMQWTGLTDRNGKEIYEGDVVYFANTKVPRWIKFHNGSFTLFQGESRRLTLGELWPSEDIEVIGNIHENPELINS